MDRPNFEFTLTPDEALVLSDLLARFEDSQTLAFAHPAEYLALQRVSAQLDRVLTEPFDPDYQVLVEAARARVANGFEGDVLGSTIESSSGFQCCFCGRTIEDKPRVLTLEVEDGGYQHLYAHNGCLERVLHESVPLAE